MQTSAPSAASLAYIGIDIGKDVFHIVGFDAKDKIAFRRQIKRLALIETFKDSAMHRLLGGLSQRAFREPDSKGARA